MDQWNLISVFSSENCINTESFLSTWFEHDSFGTVDSMSWAINIEEPISLTLVDPSGCAWLLDTTFFHVSDSANVQVLALDTLCEEELLNFDDYFVSNVEGTWFVDGVSEPAHLSAGSHSVQFEFDNGCVWDTTIIIVQAPSPSPVLNWYLSKSCVLFNVTMDSNLVENVLWNDSIWSSSICFDLVPDVISYQIVDELGCEHIFSENLDISLSLAQTQREMKILLVTYYDSLGRIVWTGTNFNYPLVFGFIGPIIEEVIYEGNRRGIRRIFKGN
jgi:hypothetical protein